MTPRTILRDSALTLPVLVVVSSWVGGAQAAAVVSVSGALALLNLVTFAWLTARLMRALEANRGGAMGLFLVLKTFVVLGAYLALVTVLDPIWVGVGLAGTLLGFGIAGLRLAWQTADVETRAEAVASSLES